MVCIYCESPTNVSNSRLQKRSNQIWRRRNCQACGNTFTTHEKVDLEGSIAILFSTKEIRPFRRDMLFISVYECCKHRGDPVSDADGLTQTIINRLRSRIQDGTVLRHDVVNAALETLRHFDSVTATMYAAYHPVTK
jgi:transcriptional repressor NrdR